MFIEYFPEKDTRCPVCKEREICSWYASVGYICQGCLSRRRYSVQNTCIKGRKQKRLPTFSLEFEVQPPDDKENEQLERAYKLLRYQFVRASDSTVADEYKSPLYLSLSAFSPALEVMNELQSLVGEQCGTHLHVECSVKADLSQCLGEIFGPLVTYLLTNPRESLLFWGRGLNDYAKASANERYFLFNARSDHPTLEFRLPRFRSKEQYLTIVKFARSCTERLNRKLPLLQQTPEKLSAFGGELLDLYTSYVQQQEQAFRWFDGLSQEQQEALQSKTYGWRSVL